MSMLCAAIGKGRHRREWVFGLRWVREQSHDPSSLRKWGWKRPSLYDGALKDAVHRAIAGGDPGFAHARVSDDLLIGWPDKGSHLKGDEFAASLGIASVVGTGLVLNYFAEERKLWGLLLNDGSPMPNGEYLLAVDGDVTEELNRLIDHCSDAEQYTGKQLPIFASENLLPKLRSLDVAAEAFDVGDQLESIRKPRTFQLLRVKKARGHGKPNLMYAILGVAVILAMFRDDIWTLFQEDQSAQVTTITPIGPTPDEKYLQDINAAMAGALNGGPQTIETVFELIRHQDLRQGGWRLKQIECEGMACKLDWSREKGGIPGDLPGATMTSLNGASTTLPYKTTTGDLGITLPVTNLRAFGDVVASAREANMNSMIYPSLLKLMDVGYSVSLGPATPLVVPPKTMTRVVRVIARPLTIGGGISGISEPLLVEAWKELPKNVTLKKVTLRIGKLSSDDRLDIQGTVITVEGAK
jgi:hypothetical protein